MKNKYIYQILVLSVFVILLSAGIYIGVQVTNKSNEQTVKSVEVVSKNDDIKIYQDETVSTKKYDIELIYQDYYSLCNETITKKDVIYGTNVEKLKKDEYEKQKLEQKEYEVLEEDKDKLVFRRTLNQNCPNHFLIKLENGIITIYNNVTDMINTEYKKIDISQELIRPELLEELNNGIKVNSKDELNLLIEDIES